MTPQNKKLNGNELLTVTATLTRDQWLTVLEMMHKISNDDIIDELEQAYSEATYAES